MKKTTSIALMLLISNTVFSQWQNTPVGTSISDPTYRSGDVTIGGTLKVGTYLKVTPNQICVENGSTDLYVNNATAGNGNVWLGKTGQGLITVMNNLYGANNITAGNYIKVGSYLKVTNNQICVEDQNTPLYINSAATGNGNVWMGKTGAGIVSVMNEFNVSYNGTTNFKVMNTGRTVIGNQIVTSRLNSLLSVSGEIDCKSLYVLKPTTWQDRVFENSYKLADLKDVEEFILAQKHLPGLKSEKEILRDGYDVNEIDAVLLEKIENLYLYVIQQQKEINLLKTKLEQK